MSSKNMGKPLTADLVFTKTKSDSLHNIKNLNLWGNDLEDLQLIQKMPNLQVVSLSVNRISSLKDFSKCMKMQELYLRKNNIVDLRQIKYLMKLPSLKVLWLHDNPCAQVQNYRQIVIKYLPNLVKLDNHQITQQQRISSQKISYNMNSSSAPVQQNDGYQEQKWNKPPPSSYYSNKPPIEERPPPPSEQKWQKKPQSSHQNQYSQQNQAPQQYQQKKPNFSEENEEQEMSRNQNILMAVLSLMRQLDNGSLQIIKREADKMLQ